MAFPPFYSSSRNWKIKQLLVLFPLTTCCKLAIITRNSQSLHHTISAEFFLWTNSGSISATFEGDQLRSLPKWFLHLLEQTAELFYWKVIWTSSHNTICIVLSWIIFTKNSLQQQEMKLVQETFSFVVSLTVLTLLPCQHCLPTPLTDTQLDQLNYVGNLSSFIFLFWYWFWF